MATLGDLAMLWVANAPRPELGLPAPPAPALWVGGVLGVAAIPVYAAGYRAAADLVAARTGRASGAARAVARLGAATALLGTLIHGWTALFVSRMAETPAAAPDPLSAVATSGPLLALWALAAAAVLAASVLCARVFTRDPDPRLRAAGIATPAAGTLALAALGLGTPLGAAFLTPAAPNLAHALFFAACAGHRARPA